jgi:hypothetical protein
LTVSLNCRKKAPGGVILPGIIRIEQILWVTSLCVHLGLISRLSLINPKRYRWFIAYLIVASAGTIYLLSLPLHSTAYATSWIIVQISSLFLLYAAALEIFGLLAEHFGAVNREGRFVSYLRPILNAIMALSLIVCLALAIFDARVMLDKQAFSVGAAVSAAVLLKRVATSTLAMFLAGSSLYFSRFRVELQPNLRIHGLLFTAWMAVSAAALFWRNLDKPSTNLINVAYLSLSILIFGVWIVALKKTGESVPVRPAIAERAYQADRETLISFLRKLTRQR